MHDALALAIAADRSLVTHAPLARVDVELTGTHTRGMTVADLRAYAPKEQANAHVVLEVDSARFIARWMEVITSPPPSRARTPRDRHAPHAAPAPPAIGRAHR